jgi:hypothetical protein
MVKQRAIREDWFMAFMEGAPAALIVIRAAAGAQPIAQRDILSNQVK